MITTKFARGRKAGSSLLALAALSTAFLVAPLAGAQAFAASYKVMSGDTVKIDVFLSPEHSAESKVDDDGQISLPAIGRVQASGLTLEEIETTVVDKLTKLSDNPSARVVASISQYRPIFVTGAVNNPGQFSYAAHTTVLQALALAGGAGSPLASKSDSSSLVDRQEKYDVAVEQMWSALARRARLSAEQKNATTVTYPQDLVSKLAAAGKQSIIDRENEIFSARRTTLSNSLETIDAQKVVVNSEIDSAKVYADDVRDSVPEMQRELDNLTSLRDKGLTRRLEVLTVQRQVSDMKKETRSSELSISRSQRELNDLNRQASNLLIERQAEVSQSLADTEVEIATLNARVENQGKLLFGGTTASSSTPAAPPSDPAATSETTAVASFSYEIVRLNADGIATTLSGDENTLLQPGDVLKVLPVTPATQAAATAASN